MLIPILLLGLGLGLAATSYKKNRGERIRMINFEVTRADLMGPWKLATDGTRIVLSGPPSQVNVQPIPAPQWIAPWDADTRVYVAARAGLDVLLKPNGYAVIKAPTRTLPSNWLPKEASRTRAGDRWSSGLIAPARRRNGTLYWSDPWGREWPLGTYGSAHTGWSGYIGEMARGIGKGAAFAAKSIGPAIATWGTSAAQITQSPLWDVAQTGAWFLPGIGPEVSGAMAITAAIGRGEAIEDALYAGARELMPPGARSAWDAAIGVIASGGDASALARMPRDLRPAAELAYTWATTGKRPTPAEIAAAAASAGKYA